MSHWVAFRDMVEPLSASHWQFPTSTQHLRADKAGQSRDLLAHNGIDCPDITRAGTGTFEFE
jgi:D-serine deaminase-like pyridoxal phosphate-dependent protein